MQNSNNGIQNAARRLLAKSAFVSMLVFAAAGPISCALIDDHSVAASASPAVAATKVARVNQAYGYNIAAKPEMQAVKIRAAYYGTGPYICSPSGFGQKSRCFARQSI